MPGHKRKRRDAIDDPLKSTQRDDGLWESIEQDEETVLGSENDATPLPIKQDTRRSITPRNIQLNSIGTQTSPLPPAANQHPPSPASAATHEPVPPPARRRRGRPPKAKTHEPPPPPPQRKSTNEPSIHRRHVRFTDPEPSDAVRSRAAHVFVRLHRVLVQLGGHLQQQAPSRANSSPRQVEFVWNNRAKAWKLSGDRGAEGMVELHGLLEQPPERLSIVRPFVCPTEKGGVRQPLEMAWDPETFCFQGVNLDNEAISITLGEMKDMAQDPWRRQYVGYIMS